MLNSIMKKKENKSLDKSTLEGQLSKDDSKKSNKSKLKTYCSHARKSNMQKSADLLNSSKRLKSSWKYLKNRRSIKMNTDKN